MKLFVMPDLLYDMQLWLVPLRNTEYKEKRFWNKTYRKMHMIKWLNKTYTVTKKYNRHRFEGADHIKNNQREQRNVHKKKGTIRIYGSLDIL